ncbi:hypothetical protein Tco_1379023 [Tanacetum coccineum]
MRTNEQTSPSQPTPAVRNTLGKEQVSQDLSKPAFDAALREYCNRNYHQLLPIIAETVHQEKVQQEKLKAVKARLNFEEVSQHSESGTPSGRRDLKKRLGSRHVRNISGSPKPRRGRSKSPRKKDSERKRCSKGWRKVYSTGLETRERNSRSREIEFSSENVITKEHPHERWKHYQIVKVAQEDTGSQNQIDRSRALRMICPNHGYVKKQILSLPESVTLIFQKPECPTTSRHTTEVKTQKIT